MELAHISGFLPFNSMGKLMIAANDHSFSQLHLTVPVLNL